MSHFRICMMAFGLLAGAALAGNLAQAAPGDRLAQLRQ